MNIQEITPKHQDFINLFNKYCCYFPEIERNTLESLNDYYLRSANSKSWKYKTLVVYINNEIAGGAYFNIFYNVKAIVLEFIFIDEKFRKLGIAKQLLKIIKEINDFPIVIECEKQGSALPFWQHNNFNILDYNYIQPPIVQGNEPFDGLCLLSNEQLSTKQIKAIIEDTYWKLSFATID